MYTNHGKTAFQQLVINTMIQPTSGELQLMRQPVEGFCTPAKQLLTMVHSN